MKRILQSLVVATLLLLAGCSFVAGASVVVRPESAETFKGQVEAFVRSKGFVPVGPLEGKGFVLILSPHPGKEPQRGLYASFHHSGDMFTFFIGKGNSRNFSHEERMVVGEVIDFLIQHSDMIQSGSASRASSTEEARAAFHAKFKKS